jgi:hypothetical protein
MTRVSYLILFRAYGFVNKRLYVLQIFPYNSRGILSIHPSHFSIILPNLRRVL